MFLRALQPSNLHHRRSRAIDIDDRLAALGEGGAEVVLSFHAQ